ncbi:unnamed protein product, partial [Symbiodinium necroappetens]
EETARTLKFASTVRKVTNFPKQMVLPVADYERWAAATGGDAWCSAVGEFLRRGEDKQ